MKNYSVNYDPIRVASDNDPRRPEFPPGSPSFPASNTRKIIVPGLDNVFVKDESTNPTGTHKDRMAWEIVVTYQLMKERIKPGEKLPQMSIISSGSAALAIQSMLRQFGFPNLKVLVDTQIPLGRKTSLEQIGCEVYQVDLSQKELDADDILEITNNPDGFDITSNIALKPTSQFYDWLSYEILNNNADFYMVPFGTGALYENLLNTCSQIRTKKSPDRRFMVDPAEFTAPNLIGATTSNPETAMDKLYSPFLPFKNFDKQALGLLKKIGGVGAHSNVYPVQEQYVAPAMKIARENSLAAEPSALSGLALLLQMQKDKTLNFSPTDKIVIVSTGKSKWQ